LVEAMTKAKQASQGTWSTDLQWMTDKGNERTAPKKKKP